MVKPWSSLMSESDVSKLGQRPPPSCDELAFVTFPVPANDRIATRPQPLPWQHFETQRLPGDGSQRALGAVLVIGFGVAFWTTVFLALLGH